VRRATTVKPAAKNIVAVPVSIGAAATVPSVARG